MVVKGNNSYQKLLETIYTIRIYNSVYVKTILIDFSLDCKYLYE